LFELYPQIKLVHVAAVIASGSLFLLRGLAIQVRASWAMAAPIRYLSYGIDIVLLAAALALVSMLPWATFANGWLWAKLFLLLGYVVLGSFALKRGRTRAVRAACLIASMALFACVYAIARTHNPFGPLALLST
jgi:uncharacterized membrane protein SirB2